MNPLSLFAGLLAQGDPAAEPVQIQSVWDFVVRGGVLMIPIGLCSLLAIALIVERSVSLRRSRIIPPGFLPELQSRLASGGNGKNALEYCRSDSSPLARVFLAGIRRFGEPTERLEKHIEEEGQRVVLSLRKHMRTLSVIASIAPLLGLLGTIFGMIRAFQTVAGAADALGRTEMLARGIYEAMITTAAGLIVAIPVIIAYHWISARIDGLVLEIDRMTVDFLDDYAKGRLRAASQSTPVSASTESVATPRRESAMDDATPAEVAAMPAST